MSDDTGLGLVECARDAAGHRDAELILFSPQAEHTPVIDHILAKLTTA
jgi:hypothetical protein